MDLDAFLSATPESGDPSEKEALDFFSQFFEDNRASVFFSRQLEVRYEDRWYHWVTNRALRDLIERGLLRSEVRTLNTGGSAHLMWHRRHRYSRRDAKALAAVIEEYADPNIAGAVGLHGELMVLEGFARRQFVMKGRNTRSYAGRMWSTTEHDLNFIFERDEIAYGIEVKNTLGYMDHGELSTKLSLCKELGLKPVIAARMLPKSWIKEVVDAGGFALILKYQLYPVTHKDLARRVARELGLPVDTPRALQDGTMDRFERWHERFV